MRAMPLTVMVLLAATAVWQATTATAKAPDRQGWWYTAPAAAPGVAASPPDVPSDGLLVQGSADAPTAFAALDYQIGDEDVGVLLLKLAPGGTTAPGTALTACPLAAEATVADEHGGFGGSAPEYQCDASAAGALTEDGAAFTFPVAALVSDGRLAVAIVPAGSADRAVFERAGPDSLAVTPKTSTESGESTDDPPAGAFGGNDALGQTETPGSSFEAPPPNALPTTPPADSGSVTPELAFAAPEVVDSAPILASKDRKRSTLGVIVFLGLVGLSGYAVRERLQQLARQRHGETL